MRQRFSGLPHALGLLLLAQTIALSGWMLRSAYLRGLGAVLFIFPVLSALGRWKIDSWWPGVFSALAAAGVVNRLFLRGGVWYSVGATAALAAVGADFEPIYFRPVLLTIAAGVLGVALRWGEKAEAKAMGAALAVVSLWLLIVRMSNTLIAVTLGLPAVVFFAHVVRLCVGSQP